MVYRILKLQNTQIQDSFFLDTFHQEKYNKIDLVCIEMERKYEYD